jgi:hypothetical protein
MSRFASTLAAAALLLSADASGLLRTPLSSQPVNFSPDETLPSVRDILQDSSKPQGPDTNAPAPNSNAPVNASSQFPKAKPGPLQPDSRLTLIRFVDGEFARVVKSIPAGKKGLHIKAGAPLDDKTVRMAVGASGSSINPGDQAQVTNLEFKSREIVIDINNGARGKTRLRDRIHLQVGGVVPTVATTGPDYSSNTNVGATIYLDFDKAVPDMTPDDLKQYLSGFLDFSKQHSAAVQWVETLPPEVQKAIQDKRAVVGMDHEMVVAAIGRPDRKVREKGPDGNELEDWIYGKPPEKTVFVVFEGDKVTQVKQFPE